MGGVLSAELLRPSLSSVTAEGQRCAPRSDSMNEVTGQTSLPQHGILTQRPLAGSAQGQEQERSVNALHWLCTTM